MRQAPRKTLLSMLIAGICSVTPLSGFAYETPNENGLDRLLKAGRNVQERTRLSPVREAALRASARTLGTQTGLIERAKQIVKSVDARKAKMERAFRFGDLVIGAGLLPPVLVHTKNAATVQNDVMRLAGAVYQIKQPARFFTGAPSWRDWLLMGLPSEADTPEIPRDEQLLPRDNDERAFWEQEVKAAYASGRVQAQEIFDHNLSLLEEVYLGMRTFYDLYQRNMVSAPVIAQAQQIITQDDPNTIVVGDTLFRITMPAQFQTNHEKWRVLTAEHIKQERLPLTPGFDSEQVRQAYAVYQEQQLQRHLEKEKGSLKRNAAQVPEQIMVEPIKAANASPPVTQSATRPLPPKDSGVKVYPVRVDSSIKAINPAHSGSTGATTGMSIEKQYRVTVQDNSAHVFRVDKQLFKQPSR